MHTQAAQDLERASACSEKQARKAQVSWSLVLVSDPSAVRTLPTHLGANSNEPVTLLKAPAACLPGLLSATAVAGLKPGGLVLWFSPGLAPPASIFFPSALSEEPYGLVREGTKRCREQGPVVRPAGKSAEEERSAPERSWSPGIALDCCTIHIQAKRRP